MNQPDARKQEQLELHAFAIEAARLMADRHCEDVLLLNVRGLSQVCDYVLIGSGTSDRQMKSLADELGVLGRDNGHAVFRSDRDARVTWLVVDFVGLVVHLFEPDRRAYYDLESLWSDAENVSWQQEVQPTRIPPVHHDC